jgi:hypothetical protein
VNHAQSMTYLSQHSRSGIGKTGLKPHTGGLGHPGPLSRPDQPQPHPKKPRVFLPCFARGVSGGHSRSVSINQGTTGNSSSESESSGEPVCVGFGGSRVVDPSTVIGVTDRMVDEVTPVGVGNESGIVEEFCGSVVGISVTEPVTGIGVPDEKFDRVITVRVDNDSGTVEGLCGSIVGMLDLELVILLHMLNECVLTAVEGGDVEILDDEPRISVELCGSMVGTLFVVLVVLLQMLRESVLIAAEGEDAEIADDESRIIENLCDSIVGILVSESVALLRMPRADVLTVVVGALLSSVEVPVLLFVTNEIDTGAENNIEDNGNDNKDDRVGLDLVEAELCQDNGDNGVSDLAKVVSEGVNDD